MGALSSLQLTDDPSEASNSRCGRRRARCGGVVFFGPRQRRPSPRQDVAPPEPEPTDSRPSRPPVERHRFVPRLAALEEHGAAEHSVPYEAPLPGGPCLPAVGVGRERRGGGPRHAGANPLDAKRRAPSHPAQPSLPAGRSRDRESPRRRVGDGDLLRWVTPSFRTRASGAGGGRP